MPYAGLFVPVALTLIYYVLTRRHAAGAHAKAEQDNAHSRVGEVARRLGLHIVEGDPALNLAMLYSLRQQDLIAVRQSGSGSRPDVRVCLQGVVHGRHVELVVHDRISADGGFLSGTTITHASGARLAVAPRTTFPDFELYLRSPGFAMEAQRQLSLPPASLGDPTLDARFAFHCADPRVGPLLARALGTLMPLPYVHVVARGGAVAFVFTLIGLSTTIGRDEAIVHALSQLAAVIEGQPADSVVFAPGGTAGALAGGASDEQVPVPCTHCGAPMALEEAPMHAPVVMRCDYCRRRETLPADAADRVRALRGRLDQLRWAQEALQGPELAIARLIEYFKSPLVWAMYGAIVLVPLLSSWGELASMRDRVGSLPRETQLEMYRSQMLGTTMLVGMLLGTALGYVMVIWRYRRTVRPHLLARAPLAEGRPVRCRRCSGSLASSREAFQTCPFCGAQNLVTPDVARERAALLDREVKDYQARAAGAVSTFATQGFTSATFYGAFAAGIGIVLLLGMAANYALLPLLV